MKINLIFAISLFATGCSKEFNSETHVSNADSGTRISGGEAVRPQTIAAQSTAQIWIKKDHAELFSFKCSGVLIGPNTLLTAGHCFQSIPARTYSLEIEWSPPTRTICTADRKDVYVHPGLAKSHDRYFEEGRRRNDLALVKLQCPPDMTAIPVPLLRDQQEIQIGSEVSVAGIASTSTIGSYNGRGASFEPVASHLRWIKSYLNQK